MQSASKTYHFLSNKYGKELLFDIAHIESLPNYVLTSLPHQLSFYEVVLITEGSGSFLLDEQKIRIRPGAIIFTSPGQLRKWLIKKPVRGYTLFFDKDFFNLSFSDPLFLYGFNYYHQYQFPTFLQASHQLQPALLTLLHQLENEISHLQTDSSHLLRAILYQVLILLNRAYSDHYGIQKPVSIHSQFYQFRSLLEKLFASHHRVLDYVQLLAISPAQLNKLCKKYAGLSAQQMIHNKQVAEIKRCLRGTNDAITRITYQFNFSDPSNFNRFFKKHTGMTAHQYRHEM